MKLLSIELFGQYKGLRDQAFDFSTVRDNLTFATSNKHKTEEPKVKFGRTN